GESGWIAARSDDPDIVFAGSYGGLITRYDHRTGQTRAINAWPDNPMGWGAANLKYRFQWTFPIVLSPRNPNDLFIGAQLLFKSGNEGQSWQAISPDLTRNDKSKQGSSGGPITKDNTSIEYYNTIFTVAPSSKDSSVIWVGSDDGLVQVTRDGGKSWQNVTPKELPEWALVSTVEASTHDDITPLEQLSDEIAHSDRHLFTPRDAVRFRGPGFVPARSLAALGTNPPNGAIVYCYLKQKPEEEATLEVLDARDSVVRRFSSRPKEPGDSLKP